jgi:hypothetical protein
MMNAMPERLAATGTEFQVQATTDLKSVVMCKLPEKLGNSGQGTAIGTAVESTDSTLATLIGLWPTLSADQRESVLELAQSFGAD